MIFRNRPTKKNGCQKLTDISLAKGKSNYLWSELDETSEAVVSGGSTGTYKGTLGNTVLGPAKVAFTFFPTNIYTN